MHGETKTNTDSVQHGDERLSLAEACETQREAARARRAWLSAWLPRVGLFFFLTGSMMLLFFLGSGASNFYAYLGGGYCLLGIVLTLTGFLLHPRALNPLMILIQILLLYLLLTGLMFFYGELLSKHSTIGK